MRKKKNSSRIKYSKSLCFEESNSLLHCLLKLLFFKVLRHINLEQVNGIPDFPGGKHGVNCCQNHSGDSNDSSFLSSAFGNACKAQGLHTITEDCISCGACVEACPQRAITLGAPSVIHQEHCLHCGNCVEHCPVAAVIPREQETVPPET